MFFTEKDKETRDNLQELAIHIQNEAEQIRIGNLLPDISYRGRERVVRFENQIASELVSLSFELQE